MTQENPNALEDPRNQTHYFINDSLFRRNAVRFFRFIFFFLIKLKTSGQENIPESGAAVIAPNHMTNFDVFPLQFSVPRPMFAMAKAELHKNIFMDYVLRRLGSFPVMRGQRDQWALDHAERILENERLLGMFPEGTRSKGKGLRAGKTGAARLALSKNCPLIPLAVIGTQRMFKTFPRRTPIEIKIGKPIFPGEDETAIELTDRVMYAIADLLPENQRGVYAEPPLGFEV